jgi:hypothetical protein
MHGGTVTVFASPPLQRRTDAWESIALGFGFPIVADKVDSSMDIDLDTF